jgi:hypothetical protein
MKNRGQIFTWDLIFGLIIFMVVLGISIQMWETSYAELRNSEVMYEMNWLAETMSDQLVMTAGEPKEWKDNDTIAFGLADVRGVRGKVESRVLDADKVISLINAFSKDYNTARNRLLGSSRYDMYIELSCLNSTDMGCLQGLPLHYASESGACIDKTIHVNTIKHMTDAYLWYEAEDLWGNADSTFCWKGCSGDYMSSINGAPDVHFTTKPGDYLIWARVLGNPSSPASLKVNQATYPIYRNTVPSLIGWVYLGEQDLGQEAVLGFNGTQVSDQIDALLLTTDQGYDPRNNAIAWGNPAITAPCVIGNVQEGSDSFSVAKTAVMGLDPTMDQVFSGTSPVRNNVLQVKVVVWGGTAMTPIMAGGTTIAPTTLPPTALVCAGTPSEDCVSASPSAISITGIALDTDTIFTCGASKPVTVSWSGSHMGDPNYFGFFIDNSSYPVGRCQSDNSFMETIGETYVYDMSCTIDAPAGGLGLSDGPHDLIVTAEDYGGYCYPKPDNTSQDDERSTPVDLVNCISYIPIVATAQTPPRIECSDLSDTVDNPIHRVDGPMTLICGNSNTINVYWGGWHGADHLVQWSYLLNASGRYVPVGYCQSNVVDTSPPKRFYQMSCTFTPTSTGSIPNGVYRLYVVAESDTNTYCTDPQHQWAEAIGNVQVGVINC